MKNNSLSDLRVVLDHLIGTNNILSNNILFIDFTGSHEKAQLLSQMWYWSGKTKDEEGWFFKTYRDWFKEIRVPEHSVRRFAGEFKDQGFLNTCKRKIKGAPVLHYRLNKDALIERLVEFCSLRISEPDNLQGSEPDNLQGSMEPDNLQGSYNTETTLKDYSSERAIENFSLKGQSALPSSDGGAKSYNSGRVDRIEDMPEYVAYQTDLEGILRKHDKSLRASIRDTDFSREEFLETFIHWCYTSGKEFREGGAGLPKLLEAHAKFLKGDGKKVLAPAGLEDVVDKALAYCARNWTKQNGMSYQLSTKEREALITILTRKYLSLDELRVLVLSNTQRNPDFAFSFEFYEHNPRELRDVYEARKHIGEKKMKKVLEIA